MNDVIKGKLLQSEILLQQAENNSKGQFSNSPDLMNELTNAGMDAEAAHRIMSRQLLESESMRRAMLEILLGPCQLYEALRSKATAKRAATAVG